VWEVSVIPNYKQLNFKTMGLKVFKECCKNCLLSEERIVSSKRAKEIIKNCAEKQTHFICHKATMNGDEEVVCKKFFDTIGYKSQMVRIAERLNALEFVEQSDTEKLPTFKEMSTRQRSLVK
jgi:hypothetical protein